MSSQMLFQVTWFTQLTQNASNNIAHLDNSMQEIPVKSMVLKVLFTKSHP